LRAECFFRSLEVLYGGLRIGPVNGNFWSKNWREKNFSAVNFFNFCSSKPRIRIGIQPKVNEYGYETLVFILPVKKNFSLGKAEGVCRQRFSRRQQQRRPQVLHARLPQAGLRRREAPAGAGQGAEGGRGGRRRYSPQEGAGAGRRRTGRC
jgi:hypothetical protein